MRACACAIAATDAAVVEVNHFGLRGLTLGVVTPPAAQSTALEKDSRSNSRPVVECKPHNIKDEAGLRWRGQPLQGTLCPASLFLGFRSCLHTIYNMSRVLLPYVMTVTESIVR